MTIDEQGMWVEPYCDYCEREGHTFRSCPARDDDPGDEDLDEQLGYDADHSDLRQFCRHGTFIGSWWGPDYLCGACELGDD